jgi:two-component system chemotaxis response regulator CheB
MTDRLIAIGASTGGTEAVREVLAAMPADAPAVVITQHIPAAFSRPFAERLNRASPMSVSEAQDGQPIVSGCAYVAPGDRHLVVQRDGAHFRCRLSDGPPVNRHRPSVDVLFRSVAQAAGPNAVGAILTGMGEDGALGLREMRGAGAATVAQDEATSVVWGMPGTAVRLGAVTQVLPLERIAAELLRLAGGSMAQAATP